VLGWLKEAEITHIVLAGFLWMIPINLIRNYPDRIINIHPALLPKFGGKGMYGIKVHEAVKAAGDSETGITIHEVNAHYDEGKILFQQKCSLEKSDSPQQIAHKVQQLEHQHYPAVIEKWVATSF
jgi:phosphoribosylglycinamide formyltransferase-1